MRYGDQISGGLIAAADRELMQRAERRREIEMTAPETGIELPATRINPGGFLVSESDDAVMIPARAACGSRRHERKDRILA